MKLAFPVEARRTLQRLAERDGVTFSTLDKVIGCHDGFIARFVRVGRPALLTGEQIDLLAGFFGEPAEAFGLERKGKDD